jgi:predicted nucleic acid-binding protein
MTNFWKTSRRTGSSQSDESGPILLIVPDLSDHIEAATLQTTCRRKGIQIGTIDALLAQLAIGHDLEFLTTDHDFTLIAGHVPLRILTEG